MIIKVSILIIGLVSTFLSILIAAYTFSKRNLAPSALSFSALMAANAFYALAYTIELAMPTKELAILLLKIEYVGVAFVPVFWFIFSCSIASNCRRNGRMMGILLCVIPVLTLILMWTNGHHGLIYRELHLMAGSPVTTFSHNVRGPWFYVFVFYSYTLLAVGSIQLLYYLSQAPGDFKDQTIMIVLGILFPWLGHFTQVIHASPWGLDMAPLAFSLSGIFLCWGIFKLRLFDLMPIAREKVLDAIHEGILVLDQRDRLVDSNRMARSIFPELNQLPRGINLPSFLGDLDLKLIEDGSGQIFQTMREGTLHQYRISETPILDGRGKDLGAVLIISDITETSDLLEKLTALATIDELTGAVNRREFFVQAREELEGARKLERPTSFAIFDLDHFKDINDSWGREMGDRVLRQVSVQVRSMLKPGDLLCRWGGEEFMLMMRATAPAEATRRCEILKAEIALASFTVPKGSFSVTASFGVSGSLDRPDETLETYIDRADTALFIAKERGRDSVILSSENQLNSTAGRDTSKGFPDAEAK